MHGQCLFQDFAQGGAKAPPGPPPPEINPAWWLPKYIRACHRMTYSMQPQECVLHALCIAHIMRLHHARGAAPHLLFGQLDKPRADVMISSMSEQKAFKPRTQDSQRKLL